MTPTRTRKPLERGRGRRVGRHAAEPDRDRGALRTQARPTTGTVLVVLWTVGAAAVLVTLAMHEPGLAALQVPGAVRAPWWTLFLAGLVTESLVVRMRIGSHGIGMSTNEVAVVAGLLLAPPAVAVPSVAAGVATALLLRRDDTLVKRLFNGSMAVITTSIPFLALPLLAPDGAPLASVGLGVAAIAATLIGTALGNAHLLLVIRSARGQLTMPTVRTVGLTTLVALAVVSVAVPGIQLIGQSPELAWIAAPGIGALLALLTLSGRIAERLTDVEVQVRTTRAIADATLPDRVIEEAQRGLTDLLGGEVAALVLHDKTHGWQAHWRTGDDTGQHTLQARDVTAIRRALNEGDHLVGLVLCGVPGDVARSITQVVHGDVALRGGRRGLTIIGRPRTRVVRLHDGKLLASIASLVGSAMDRLDLITTLSDHLTERVHHASHDDLTNELNRNAFEEATAVRLLTRRLVSVIAVDLDGFGTINRVLGHDAGDTILRLAAERLHQLGEEDLVVARLGNDEFGVLAPDGVEPEQAARSVIRLFEEPLLHDGVPIDVPVHVGLASVTNDQGVQPRDLIRRATVALQAARPLGRQFARWQPELDADGEQLLATAGRLRQALREGTLTAHYQPQIRLSDGVAVGMEALARWTDPELGPIGPEVFVPIAEQTGLIDELTLQILDQALQTWVDLDPLVRPTTVSVNVSPRVLVDEHLPTSVAIALARFEVPASTLVIEVTESTQLHEDRRADQVLGALKDLGVGIALDDYGTGYASMAALRRTDADELKVDQSFIAAAAADRSAAAIIEASVALAQTLRLRTVAEGIEHGEQAVRLRELGCELGQGWLWSPALSAQDLETWLHERAIKQALRSGDEAEAARSNEEARPAAGRDQE